MSMPVSLSIALSALRRNTLRTVLALLGLAVGVGAVLTTVALGTGAQSAIADQVKAAGLNVLIVTAGNFQIKMDDSSSEPVAHQASLELAAPDEAAGPWAQTRLRFASAHPEDDPMEKHNHPTAKQRLGDALAGLGSAATLTQGDADAIRDLIYGVQYVAGGIHENVRASASEKRWFTRLHGTDVDLPKIRRAFGFSSGRFFSKSEMDAAEQVAVLGAVAAEKLFGQGVNPVGQEVKLWNQPFKVVGVAFSSNWMVSAQVGDDQFDAVYVPVTTVHRLLNLTKLNTITVTAASSGDVTRVAKEVAALLRTRHSITDQMPDDFTVRTQARDILTKGLHPTVARTIAGNVSSLEQVTLEQLAGTLERSSRTMTLLLGCIAAVSLLVGGIGISNVMLLAVTERTREIGVRLAVGAKERDVRAQFLSEALTLSLAGGVCGVIVGVVAALAVRQFLGWATNISMLSVVVSFGVAAAVGVFAGLYPAYKASRLDPIDALRYE
ncbi:MAG: ABC transporter permease [Vicinamibacterales bacterium]